MYVNIVKVHLKYDRYKVFTLHETIAVFSEARTSALHAFICTKNRTYVKYTIFSGNVDIVNGNLKLILGLIWSLIVRYQIGRSKFPPR